MEVKYNVNYDEERFQNVKADEQTALNDLKQTYDSMIGDSDQFYQAQGDFSKNWADKQTELQQQQSDFAIEQIEQQKEKAEKDYTKQQQGAYIDWRKQSNEYGATAEAMAASGLSRTGYSESSQVSMYNTYQNRINSAREVYNNAKLSYDNAIKDAMLQNNSALAQIAFDSYQTQLEMALQGFQYKNQLLLDRVNAIQNAQNMYYGRYQDVLNQINTEISLAEQIRQFNEQMAEEQRQFNFKNKLGEFAPVASSSSGGGGGGGSSSRGSSGGKGGSGGSGDDGPTLKKDKYASYNYSSAADFDRADASAGGSTGSKNLQSALLDVVNRIKEEIKEKSGGR